MNAPVIYKEVKLKLFFLLLPRLLDEEAGKRAELEQLHLHQQRALCQTEAEKQELVAKQLAKERQLKEAMLQLDQLEKERHGALEKYQVRSHDIKSLIKTLYAFCYTHFQSSELIVCNVLLQRLNLTINHHPKQLPLLAM